MPNVENNHVVEGTDEARAGTTGHGVRYVLGVGTVAVVALFMIVYLYYFA